MNCTFDGVRLTYHNLNILLPMIAYVLKFGIPHNYERKCISEIYLEYGLLIIF